MLSKNYFLLNLLKISAKRTFLAQKEMFLAKNSCLAKSPPKNWLNPLEHSPFLAC